MHYLFRIYQWIIAFPILVGATILTAISTSIGSVLGDSKWWGFYPALLWSRFFCALSFVKVEVRGRENLDKNTSYMFIANHQGAYDIFTIYGYLNHNFRWMMKKSLEKLPFIGYACNKAGHIMVDRSSSSAIKSTMASAKKKLNNGMSLVVFPEGARTWNGKMRSFKKGAFKLAVEFNLPLVPLTIDGSFSVMPRTSYHVTPGKIILTIHKPIFLNEENINDIDALMTESFKSIQSKLPENLKN